MKSLFLTIAFIIATPAVASANVPVPDKQENGWFSPTFYESPVNVIFCVVKDACKF